MDTQNQNQNGGDNNKVAKAYEKNMLKVQALLGGDVKLPTKAKKGDMSSIVAELFKEETEATNLAVKNGLKELVKTHVTAGKAINAKKQELAQLELQKKKEFNEAAVKLFNQIEGVDSLLAEYQRSLGDAVNAVEETEEETEE